jgi:hypothetical protein
MRTYAEAVDGDGDRDPAKPDTPSTIDQGAGRPRLHRYMGTDKNRGDESLAEELRKENGDRDDGA